MIKRDSTPKTNRLSSTIGGNAECVHSHDSAVSTS